MVYVQADTVLDRLTLAEESLFSHENCRLFFGYGGACFALEAGIPLWCVLNRFFFQKATYKVMCVYILITYSDFFRL